MNMAKNENLIVGFKKPITEEKLKQLPNHLKSIMLAKSSNGSVKAEKLKNLLHNSIIEKSEQESENKFDFEMLKQIERLVGYEVDKKGNLLIKSPIWKVLTQQDYESLVGKEIVCRMVKYENNDIGIEPNRGLETPTYDDYFILIPRKIKIENPFSKHIPVVKKKLEEKILTTIKEVLPGLELVERNKKGTKKETVLANLASKFTIVDLNEPTEVITKDDKKNVKVKGKSVGVVTDMIVDALALDCQSANVEQEFMSSNIIAIDKFNKVTEKPEVIAAIFNKKKEIEQEFDELEDDRCSAFGKYRPNTAVCSDKK